MLLLLIFAFACHSERSEEPLYFAFALVLFLPLHLLLFFALAFAFAIAQAVVPAVVFAVASAFAFFPAIRLLIKSSLNGSIPQPETRIKGPTP